MHPIHQEMGMSFRRRRGLSLRPVNRIKHVVDSQFAVILAVQSNLTLIEAKDAPVLANTAEVQTGSTVNAIYVNVEAYATSAGALANVYLAFMKNPGSNLTNIVPNTVGSSDDKRFVIHQEMKMVERSVNGNPRTLFNGVIVIPRGYRRFAPDDRLIMAILSPGVNLDMCAQAHYKEFR